MSWRRIGRWLGRLAVLVVFAGAGCWALTEATHGPRSFRPPVIGGGVSHLDDAITLMTVNLAHGRSDGFHQVFTSSRAVRRNLEAVAELVAREAPDVVAMQEADGPSVWSGRFDHVAFLADAADMAVYLRGEHVRGLQLRYGTALMSRAALADPLSITFDPSPPTFSKGFVVATVAHPRLPEGLDVVSLHLDFARRKVRGAQVQRLIEVLRARGRPVVIMGDFNTRWRDGGHIAQLAATFSLHTFDPAAKLITFPTTNARLDWILVPGDFAITHHAVLEDVVSDHRAVVLRLRIPPAR